jgi:hypothetical protein
MVSRRVFGSNKRVFDGNYHNNNMLGLNNYDNKKSMAMFSTTSFTASETKELRNMRDEDLKSLRIDQDMLMRDLHDSCEWGVGIRWGR